MLNKILKLLKTNFAVAFFKYCRENLFSVIIALLISLIVSIFLLKVDVNLLFFIRWLSNDIVLAIIGFFIYNFIFYLIKVKTIIHKHGLKDTIWAGVWFLSTLCVIIIEYVIMQLYIGGLFTLNIWTTVVLAILYWVIALFNISVIKALL